MQLIFEIGCEELPARFCEPALAQIEAAFAARAEELRLEYGSLRTVATPRRLTLLVDGLAEKQSDIQEERTGPPAQISFKDGQPTKAALGFARRSEEHTSELQSRPHLVCRLLLEKKK